MRLLRRVDSELLHLVMLWGSDQQGPQLRST